MHADIVADGHAAAIHFIQLSFHADGREIGNVRQRGVGPGVVAHFEGLPVHPALRCVHLIDDNAIDRRLDFHLAQSFFCQVDFRLRLVALPRQRSHFGFI